MRSLGNGADLGVHSPSGLHTPGLLRHQHPLSSHVVSGRHPSRGHVDLPPRPAHLLTFLHGLPPPRQTPGVCSLSLSSDGRCWEPLAKGCDHSPPPPPPSRLHVCPTPGKEANTPPCSTVTRALSLTPTNPAPANSPRTSPKFAQVAEVGTGADPALGTLLTPKH